MPRPARHLTTLAACGLALSLTTALHAGDKPAGGPADALKGPAVSDRAVPGVTGSFGEAGQEKRRFMEERIPPRVFREAMNPLLADDAPDALRLPDAKRAEFKGLIDDFEKDVRDYMKQHRAELQKLRDEAGLKGGRAGKQPKAGEPPAPNAPGAGPGGLAGPLGEGASPELREKYREIMQGAPKIEDVYTKIWTDLSPEQRRAVDGRLDEWRSQRAKQREDMYVRSKTGKKAAGAAKAERDLADKRGPGGPGSPDAPDAGGPPGPGRPLNGFGPGGPRPDGPRGGALPPERRERLLELFSRLSPEQQEQVLRRLEQAGRGGPGDGAPRPDGPPPRRRARPEADRPAAPPPPRPDGDELMMSPPPAGDDR